MQQALSIPCKPITLHGHFATLIPIEQFYIKEIQAAAADGNLWELFFTSVPSPENTQSWLDLALDLQNQQKALVFLVKDNTSGKIVGSTRFCNIDQVNCRLEIGYTWYSQSVQRTAINTDCKYLLLSHAFEVFNSIAVEFRTDWFNKRSQAAIERLGAKRDGILRNQMKTPDGRIRDAVVYSIIDSEWNGVKKNLEYLLKKPRT